MLKFTLTEAGQAAFRAGTQIQVKQVGFGSNGYIPQPNQTALKAEVGKTVPVSSKVVSPGRIQIIWKVANIRQDFALKEIGIFLNDDTLFAVYSHPTKVIANYTALAPVFQITEIAIAEADATEIVMPNALNLQFLYDQEINQLQCQRFLSEWERQAERQGLVLLQGSFTRDGLTGAVILDGSTTHNLGDVALTAPASAERFYYWRKQEQNVVFADWQQIDTANPLPGTLSANPLPGTLPVASVNASGKRKLLVNQSFAALRTHVLQNQQGLTPVGTVAWYANQTAPTGWLDCQGQWVNQADYAALYAVVADQWGLNADNATFRLPDLRGEFVRGWDNSKGTDPARVLGSSQRGTQQFIAPERYVGDAYMLSLSHGAHKPINNLINVMYDPWDGGGVPHVSASYGSYLNNSGVGFAHNWRATRPRNIALLGCIKTF